MRSLTTLCLASLTTSAVAAVFAFASPAAFAQINVTGGQTFTIKNGDNYSLVAAADTSTVNVIGGMANEIDTFTNSTVNMSAGTVGVIIAQNSSKANVSGGTLSALFGVDTSTVTVSGGTISNLDYDNSTTGTASGGILPLITTVDGDVSITGGATNSIQDRGLGTTTLTGYNFALTGIRSGNTSNSNYVFQGTFFTLTGQLQNSSAVVTYNMFDSYSRTRITTGVTTLTTGKFVFNDLATGTTTVFAAGAPEPGSLPLLGMGLLSGVGGVGVVRRHRRAVTKRAVGVN